MKVLQASLAIAASVSLIAGPTLGASAAPSFSTMTVDGTKVTTSLPITTEDELLAFVAGSTPKSVTIDAFSGALETVTELQAEAELQGVSNPCATGAVCWQASKLPYANFGFAGKGSHSGAWPYRGTIRTFSHTAQAFYHLTARPGTTLQTPVMGANSVVGFSGAGGITGSMVVLSN